MAVYRSLLLLAGAGLFPAAALAVPPERDPVTCAALSANPSDDAPAEYLRASNALEANCYTVARDALKHVIALTPDANAVFRANLQYDAARASIGLKDLKAAREQLELALSLNKNLVSARKELGIVYTRMGEKAKAQAELDALKELQAKCADSCSNSDELAAAVKAVAGAIANPQQALFEQRRSPVFTRSEASDNSYVQAVGLINEGRYAEAVTTLEATLKALGQDPDILTYLGFANRKLRRFDVAEQHYRQALAIEPDHRAATEYYGELMVERGDREGAKVMLARLERNCAFGCAEADELRRWIDGAPRATR